MPVVARGQCRRFALIRAFRIYPTDTSDIDSGVLVESAAAARFGRTSSVRPLAPGGGRKGTMSVRHARRIALLFAVFSLVALSTTAASAGADKTTICHKPGTAAEKTMVVAAAAVEGHLGHGDTVGECGGGSGGIDACTALNDPVLDTQYQSANVHSLVFPSSDTTVTLRVAIPYSTGFEIYWEHGPEGGGTTRYIVASVPDPTVPKQHVAEASATGIWRPGVETYFEWGFPEPTLGAGNWFVDCG